MFTKLRVAFSHSDERSQNRGRTSPGKGARRESPIFTARRTDRLVLTSQHNAQIDLFISRRNKNCVELTENGEQHGGAERGVGDGLVLGLAGPGDPVVGRGRAEADDGDGGHAAVGGLLPVGQHGGLVLVLTVFCGKKGDKIV